MNLSRSINDAHTIWRTPIHGAYFRSIWIKSGDDEPPARSQLSLHLHQLTSAAEDLQRAKFAEAARKRIWSSRLRHPAASQANRSRAYVNQLQS
jgi:hypothetical protein